MKRLLEIVIIAVVVIAVFLINPWNIFGGGAKLNPTANSVSAIKELGQLITAEYYGEVIATFDKSKIRLIEEDNISEQADWLYEQLKREVFSIYVEELMQLDSIRNLDDKRFRLFGFWKKNKEEKLAKKNLTTQLSLKGDSLFNDVIEYCWLVNNQSLNNKNKKYDSKYESKTIISLGNEVNAKFNSLTIIEFEEYLQSGLPAFGNMYFSDFYYNKLRDKNQKELKKKELAMIGRGWVKAGFDFGKLDKSNFMFDKENGVVHIFGVNAEILNADINPWFIPEKKIPGFQIIEANKNVDFEDAKQVKMYCVEKLRKKAMDAGILEQAEKQGKESIKNFVSLISGIEVQEVQFHYDLFSVKIKEIIDDEFISYVEAKMLDTLISHQVDTIITLHNATKNYTEKQRIKEVKINRLKLTVKNIKSCIYEGGGKYNRLAYSFYKISADSILTPRELKEIKKLRWDLSVTSKEELLRREIEKNVWYDTDLEFINEFNETFNFVESNTLFANLVDFVADTTTWSSNIKQSLSKADLFDFDVHNDSVFYTLVEKIEDSASFKQIKYPITIPAEIDSAFVYDKVMLSKIKKIRKDNEKDTVHVQLGDELAKQVVGKDRSSENLIVEAEIHTTSIQIKPEILNDSEVLNNEEKLILEKLCEVYVSNKNVGFAKRFAAGVKRINTDSLQTKTKRWLDGINIQEAGI